MHDCSLSWLGINTSIKRGEVKLVLWAKTSSLTSFNASCLSAAFKSCILISLSITKESSSFFLYKTAVPYAPEKLLLR
jgi:hypothetical protein